MENRRGSGQAAPDDDQVPIFGTWRRIYSAIIASALAVMGAGRLGSVIEVVNRFGSYFYGTILGVFGLAVLTPRAAAHGAFYGMFLGCTSSGTTSSAR